MIGKVPLGVTAGGPPKPGLMSQFFFMLSSRVSPRSFSRCVKLLLAMFSSVMRWLSCHPRVGHEVAPSSASIFPSSRGSSTGLVS